MFAPGDRILGTAIGVSLALHAVALAVHFKFPEAMRWKAESQGDHAQTLAQESARWQLEAEQRLESERQRWKAENAVAQAEAGVFTGVVAVYKAFGGIVQ